MNNNGFFYRSNGDFSDSVNEEDEIISLRKRVAYLEGENKALQDILDKLLASRQVSSGSEAFPTPSTPRSRPLPEEDKTLNRTALCNELIRLLLSLDPEVRFGVTLKPFIGEEKEIYRVYIRQDNSYLYFDKHGRLWSDTKGKGRNGEKKKGCLAHRLLNRLYILREHLEESPIIQAVLLKGELNGFAIEPED